MMFGVPLRLVIVDDNAPYRAGMVRAAVAHPDIELVAEADSGVAALDVIAAHRPEIALVDLRMPNVDGIDVCRALPKLIPGVDCRVVILSAATEAGVHELVLEAGAAAFLTKDLPRKDILRIVLELACRVTR